jgi:homoserine kinase type II
MAVYTEVSDQELTTFLCDYDIGLAVSFKGIAEGVENSNYLLRTDRGTFILTLYEKRVEPEDLPYFLGLMDHLAGKGIACPTPIHCRDGKALRKLCGRPSAIMSFLKGMWPRRIEPYHCAMLGEAMAKMHLAGNSFVMKRENNLSVAGWRSLFESCRTRAHDIQDDLEEIMEDELAQLEESWPTDLPVGIIHADLFPDNVFFLGETLSGIIDFYFACNDFLAYDLAICLNAWCFEEDGGFNVTKSNRLLVGYSRVRPLEKSEVDILPLLARGSAMRFLLTRLYDQLHRPEGAMVNLKDPQEYLGKLRFHQQVKDATAYGLDRTS